MQYASARTLKFMTVTKPELGECVFPTPMPSSLASAVPSAASAEHLLQHLPITAGGSLLSTSGTDPASASGASFEGNDDDNPIQTAWQVRERSTNAAAGSSLGKHLCLFCSIRRFNKQCRTLQLGSRSGRRAFRHGGCLTRANDVIQTCRYRRPWRG